MIDAYQKGLKGEAVVPVQLEAKKSWISFGETWESSMKALETRSKVDWRCTYMEIYTTKV